VLEHLDGPAGAVLHDDPPRASSARGAHPRATAARPRRS
jgi:hypothetical protein